MAIKPTIQDITEFYRLLESRELPFEEYDFVLAVYDAAQAADGGAFRNLLNEMVGAFERLDLDKSEEYKKWAPYVSLALVAYLADHGFEDLIDLRLNGVEPALAYANKDNYGPAMNLVDIVYQENNVSLMGDVFSNDHLN